MGWILLLRILGHVTSHMLFIEVVVGAIMGEGIWLLQAGGLCIWHPGQRGRR